MLTFQKFLAGNLGGAGPPPPWSGTLINKTIQQDYVTTPGSIGGQDIVVTIPATSSGSWLFLHVVCASGDFTSSGLGSPWINLVSALEGPSLSLDPLADFPGRNVCLWYSNAIAPGTTSITVHGAAAEYPSVDGDDTCVFIVEEWGSLPIGTTVEDAGYKGSAGDYDPTHQRDKELFAHNGYGVYMSYCYGYDQGDVSIAYSTDPTDHFGTPLTLTKEHDHHTGAIAACGYSAPLHILGPGSYRYGQGIFDASNVNWAGHDAPAHRAATWAYILSSPGP
jgi:hypothetical protein